MLGSLMMLTLIFLGNQLSFGDFMEKTTDRAAHGVEKTVSTMAEVTLAVMDKLAGTQSDVKLEFKDLTFEAGMIKTKMTGAVVLSLTYAKEAESTSK